MAKKVNSAAMFYLVWGAVMSYVSKGCIRSACRYCFTSNLLLGCTSLGSYELC